jgi:hypothetical protein
MRDTSNKGEGETEREGGREKVGEGERERKIEDNNCSLIPPFRRRSDNNTAGSMNRLGALEARATKRANLGQTLYLPVIFISYSLLLGKCSNYNNFYYHEYFWKHWCIFIKQTQALCISRLMTPPRS